MTEHDEAEYARRRQFTRDLEAGWQREDDRLFYTMVTMGAVTMVVLGWMLWSFA